MKKIIRKERTNTKQTNERKSARKRENRAYQHHTLKPNRKQELTQATGRGRGGAAAQVNNPPNQSCQSSRTGID